MTAISAYTGQSAALGSSGSRQQGEMSTTGFEAEENIKHVVSKFLACPSRRARFKTRRSSESHETTSPSQQHASRASRSSQFSL